MLSMAVVALLLPACGTPPKLPTQAQIQSGVVVGINAIADASRLYQAIGTPGLPADDKAKYASLASGAYQLQAQVGLPADTAVINTGSATVNKALASNITNGATVTQSDVNTVYALATPPAPVAPNTNTL